METPADFNLVGIEREEFRKWLGKESIYWEQDSAWYDIALLLWGRRDERYKEYLKKLPESMQKDFWQIASHMDLVREEIYRGKKK